MGGEVPELRTLAGRMGLPDAEAARRFADRLEEGSPLAGLDEEALAAYARLRSTILDGAEVARADPTGPRPPLSMPPWRSRIAEEDVDAILAYLLTLPGAEGATETGD